ncbi:hypothetical protein DPMN_034947 [Dreissena polymorpha]|uniref:Uncharacterized protein n=1 Tax=Dreissena polymorpha TaxID=45954 RepID=A0A9D4M8L0_DREPO|nr:hypothetical protein DPMN_034947 [Dreissena polymorpha]
MTFIHSSRYVQLVPIPSYAVVSLSLSSSNRVNVPIVHVGIPFSVRPSPFSASSITFYVLHETRSYLRRSADGVGLSEIGLDGLETDSIGVASYRLKVLNHLSRSTPFQAVDKGRRQFVTRCYYDHSVLTQFEPV